MEEAKTKRQAILQQMFDRLAIMYWSKKHPGAADAEQARGIPQQEELEKLMHLLKDSKLKLVDDFFENQDDAFSDLKKQFTLL